MEAVELGKIGGSECSGPLEIALTESNAVEIVLKNTLCNDDSSIGFELNADVSCSAPKRRRGRKNKVPLDTDINSATETRLADCNLVEIELTPLHMDGTTIFGSTFDTIAGTTPKRRRGRKSKEPLDNDTNSASKTELTEIIPVEVELKTLLPNDEIAAGFGLNTDIVLESAPKGRRGRERKVPLENTDTSSVPETVSKSVAKVRRGRKRKVPFENTKTSPAPETVLRRSTRKSRKSVLSDKDNIFSTVVISNAVDDSSSSPTISAVTEEKVSEMVGHESSEEQNVLPPKLELPPSSENLNLWDMPVIDVFYVFSFLRSFSTLLFLSPFELEDFVSSLNCDAPSILFDSIHVSLLHTLRKHLDSLPEDSSASASAALCLRSLNWDLLDMITWPVFMADYLLIHSSGMKPDFDIGSLKLLETDYYKQSPSLKIEILRCLCDDVIEADLIKSELNKRSLATELSVDFDQNMKSDNNKRRKAVIDAAVSCVTEEDNDKTFDWNSDECWLCKMDGSLICCDGCPAAFHSRCVGVVSNHLPEGDWYCPECVIDKDRPWMKVAMTIRGADLLGIDPYGQLYYSCCGYLLVLEDCDSTTSAKFYLRNDLPAVIEVLKSSKIVYNAIMLAILKHWDLFSEFEGAKKELPEGGVALHLSAHSDTHLKDSELKAEDPSFIPANMEGEISESVDVKSDRLDHAMIRGNQGSADVSRTGTRNKGKTSFDLRNRRSSVLDKLETQRKHLIIYTPLAGKNNNFSVHGNNMATMNDRIASEASCTNYVNYYNFAHTSSSIADELTVKSSNKGSEDALKSFDDIVSDQMKAISNKFTEFCWPNILNMYVAARKENCGWCFACKVPEDERECLISMYANGPTLENFSSVALGIHARKSKKSHLVDVTCHILSAEERLQGLLRGPWLNPLYSMFWRKGLLRVAGIALVKCLLLKLESNLHPLTLSADWTKHMESAATVGSSVHIMITSMRGSSRNGIGRKRVRCPESERGTASNAASGLGLLWWRGGRLSRRLFDWKLLPRALASRAARQGGCKKIPGILYPDGSELAKRCKYVAWRASVESSRSVEQLALQVRELDANIKWDDIENRNLSYKLEKESKKPIKSFKKVIVRRKCSEGTVVKYLLDFGKRRFIPDVVLRHGSKVEESSSERKRYWLEESHLPLYLLKAFEQKRLARKSNKMNTGKLQDRKRVINLPPLKRKGFSYLFSKAERSEYYQCGHCNKDVLIREAVSCQYCKGPKAEEEDWTC